MTLSRFDIAVPLERLREDARRAMDGWDWRRGAFGHVLSLAAPQDLHPSARYRYHNYPCTGLLATLPHLRAVFDSFPCHKVSFRLLRREPASAYTWHTDRWKGPGVVRFQIPIVSGPEAFLVTTDYEREQQVRASGPWLTAETFDTFAAANAGHFARHRLEPGSLYYFNTTLVHTLVNPGTEERVTLSFDLIANDWLRRQFPVIEEEAGSDHSAGPATPGLSRQSLNWTMARLHPLRTRLRRWRGHRAAS